MLPDRITGAEQLTCLVQEIGFLPLFSGPLPGFSVQEHTLREDWWSGDPLRDPWQWRIQLAREHRVAYGKFFRDRAGFLSLDWLSVFAALRRDGYDFDARWDDGLADRRSKRIMDLMADGVPRFSHEIRAHAGFGKDGEKGFEGTLTSLQRMLYLTVADLRKKTGRNGAEYGWDVAVYAAPESLWGCGSVTRCYGEPPAVLRERILGQVRSLCPSAPDTLIRRAIGAL